MVKPVKSGRIGRNGRNGPHGHNVPTESVRIGRSKMAKLAKLAQHANSADSANLAKSGKNGKVKSDTLPAKILVGSVSRTKSVQQTCVNLKNAAKQMHEANTQLCMTPFCHHKPRLIMDIVHGMCLLAVLGTAIWNVVLTIQGNATIKAMIPIFITSFFAVLFVIPSQICGALHARSVASWLSLTGSIVTSIITGILVGYLLCDPAYQNRSLVGAKPSNLPGQTDQNPTNCLPTDQIQPNQPNQPNQPVFLPRVGLISR